MTADEPADSAIAREVLTEIQWTTWALAERGISHRAIAYFRGVAKATVTDCLAECDRKIEQAKRRREHGEDPPA